eukprot:INCI4810.3.p2 GENE.INCI4810.3~~INCI4810.3.p2  ORF type:complete len:190 (+),score=55.77 INCI4810.3:151-720(+)
MEGFEPIDDRKHAYAKKRYRPVSRLSVVKKVGHLSNVEMLELLKKHRTRLGVRPGFKGFQPWIHAKTIEYLTKTPVFSQTSAQAREFLLDLKSLRDGTVFDQLTKADKLQIMNIQPVEESTLYAIVEEFETRFPEEVAEDIIALVKKHFIDPAADLDAAVAAEAKAAAAAAAENAAEDSDGDGSQEAEP